MTTKRSSINTLAALASVMEEKKSAATIIKTSTVPPMRIFLSGFLAPLPNNSPNAEAHNTQVTTNNSPLPMTFAMVASCCLSTRSPYA